MNEARLISKAMSILGSRTSPAKRAAAARNSFLGGAARWKDHIKKPKLPKKPRKTTMKPAA